MTTPTYTQIPAWNPSVNWGRSASGLLNIAKVTGWGEACPDAYSVSGSTLFLIEYKGKAEGSYATNIGASGCVYLRRLLPVEKDFRLRELMGACLVSLLDEEFRAQSTLAKFVSRSAVLDTNIRLLGLLKAHPRCPLLALRFTSDILGLPFVESVICDSQQNRLRVWTVVNNATEEQRYTIYDKQRALLQTYHEEVIDFRLLDRYDQPLDSLSTWSDSATVIPKKDAI